MPPFRRQHEWSTFELHTMLCLMAKGAHLEGYKKGTEEELKFKRSDHPEHTRRNIYENFATELNVALHGRNHREDIDKREITQMLDQLIKERKHVVGKCGLAERRLGGRITRTIKKAWERGRYLDFDGSEGEWKLGRAQREENKRRARLGLPPLEIAPVVEISVDAPENPNSPAVDKIQRQPERVAPVRQSRTQWRGSSELSSLYAVEEPDEGTESATASNMVIDTNADSLRILSAKPSSSRKYNLADAAARPGRGKPASVDPFEGDPWRSRGQSSHQPQLFAASMGPSSQSPAVSRMGHVSRNNITSMSSTSYLAKGYSSTGTEQILSNNDNTTVSAFARTESSLPAPDLQPVIPPSDYITPSNVVSASEDVLARTLNSEIKATTAAPPEQTFSSKGAEVQADAEMGGLEEDQI